MRLNLSAKYLVQPNKKKLPSVKGMNVLKNSFVVQWMPLLGQRKSPARVGEPITVQTIKRSIEMKGVVLLKCLYLCVPIQRCSTMSPKYDPAIVEAILKLIKTSVSKSSYFFPGILLQFWWTVSVHSFGAGWITFPKQKLKMAIE